MSINEALFLLFERPLTTRRSQRSPQIILLASRMGRNNSMSDALVPIDVYIEKNSVVYCRDLIALNKYKKHIIEI